MLNLNYYTAPFGITGNPHITGTSITWFRSNPVRELGKTHKTWHRRTWFEN